LWKVHHDCGPDEQKNELKIIWRIPGSLNAYFLTYAILTDRSPNDFSSSCQKNSFISRMMSQLRQSLPIEAIRGTPLDIMTLRALKPERAANLLNSVGWDEELPIHPPFQRGM